MTIIIPAYNCAKWLPRALNSLVAQTNKNFSVVVVDDCSTEDIKSICDKYNTLNLTYIRNPENVGCGMSRQAGIDYVGLNDDYITFLDADDMLTPSAVENWVNALASRETPPDMLVSWFIIKPFNEPIRAYRGMSPRGSGIFMMHGKVYNTAFLKKYDIREKAEAMYWDDYIMNTQALVFAEDIMWLKNVTYLYIKTEGSASVSNYPGMDVQKTLQLVNTFLAEKYNIYNKKFPEDYAKAEANLLDIYKQSQDYIENYIAKCVRPQANPNG